MITTTRRKVRADAKLEYLNGTQRERLHGWFEENRTYAEIVRLIRDEFELSVGKSTVSVYYRRHMLPPQEEDEAEVVAQFAALSIADFDAATLRRVEVLAFLAVARPDPDVDLAAKLLAIVWKAERHALAVRKRALKARKAALREKRAALRAAAAEKRAWLRQGVGEVEQREVAPIISSRERPNLPRFPSYSTVIQTEAEAELGTTKDTEKMKDETLETWKHAETVEPAEEGRRSESTEIAIKAQSGEGRSEGSEEPNLKSAPAGGDGFEANLLKAAA